MSVSRKEVRRVARLARLEFSDKEVDQMTSQLGEILDYASQLDEVDTAGVPPTTTAGAGAESLRRDEAEQRISREDALRSVPESDDEYVRTPAALRR